VLEDQCGPGRAAIRTTNPFFILYRSKCVNRSQWSKSFLILLFSLWMNILLNSKGRLATCLVMMLPAGLYSHGVVYICWKVSQNSWIEIVWCLYVTLWLWIPNVALGILLIPKMSTILLFATRWFELILQHSIRFISDTNRQVRMIYRAKKTTVHQGHLYWHFCITAVAIVWFCSTKTYIFDQQVLFSLQKFWSACMT
jgi:hypothetical protein